MTELSEVILKAVGAKEYKPMTAKALMRRLDLEHQDREFRKAVRALISAGRVRIGTKNLIHRSEPPPLVKGSFRRLRSGDGVVRVPGSPGSPMVEYHVDAQSTQDASDGDEVALKVRSRPTGGRSGSAAIDKIVQRATRRFVGTFFIRDGTPMARVDGDLFARSILLGDASVHSPKSDDKVVIDMVRFPTALDRGEGVIVEVLGRSGDPRVDTLSVVRALGIPDQFPEAVLEEARRQALAFNDRDFDGRTDFTGDLVITIDPVDAKDFDDAVSLTIDAETTHRILTVHIADVERFVPIGSALDEEARLRGTSVYLPRTVIPMFPEIISNGLASLQEGKNRYVKSVRMEFTTEGVCVGRSFYEGVIRNRKRFTYEEVQAIFSGKSAAWTELDPAIPAMLFEMRKLARTLRNRRRSRGSLELSMPEPVLEYDAEGHVTGAHFLPHDDSHQLIEDFMLAANEAVAEHFASHDIPFLRRIHPSPDPQKLETFSAFVGHLGFNLPRKPGKFDLQSILNETADRPERRAVHYSLLRSMRPAVYSPEQDVHFALASDHYCHFTSPIRRYPDLTVHRQLRKWIRRNKGRTDVAELNHLGVHCSKVERRAETAEREAVKLRLLAYLSDRIGLKMPAVITGTAEYGFFAQGTEFPAEGMVHVGSLSDDYYRYDDERLCLEGRRSGRTFRLGDLITVIVVRVDLAKRQLDFRVDSTTGPTRPSAPTRSNAPNKSHPVRNRTAHPPNPRRPKRGRG